MIQSSARGGRPLTSAYRCTCSSRRLGSPSHKCRVAVGICRSDAHGEATSVGATDHKARLEASASRDETVRAVLHGEGGSPRCLGVNGLVREARARDRCPVSLQVTRCPVCVSRQSRRRVTAGAWARRAGPGCQMNIESTRSGRPSLDRAGSARARARRPPGRGGGRCIGEHDRKTHDPRKPYENRANNR